MNIIPIDPQQGDSISQGGAHRIRIEPIRRSRTIPSMYDAWITCGVLSIRASIGSAQLAGWIRADHTNTDGDVWVHIPGIEYIEGLSVRSMYDRDIQSLESMQTASGEWGYSAHYVDKKSFIAAPDDHSLDQLMRAVSAWYWQQEQQHAQRAADYAQHQRRANT